MPKDSKHYALRYGVRSFRGKWDRRKLGLLADRRIDPSARRVTAITSEVPGDVRHKNLVLAAWESVKRIPAGHPDEALTRATVRMLAHRKPTIANFRRELLSRSPDLSAQVRIALHKRRRVLTE